MKAFKHINAKAVEEAVSALQTERTVVNAGGTDLVGALRFKILPNYRQR
jgi:CO/xanthine dehydrogenase FAD-binding subunit